MKNAIITVVMVATVLTAGCSTKSPDSSATPPQPRTRVVSSAHVSPQRQAMLNKASNIVLKEYKLDGVTLIEALKRLTDLAVKNDPENKGFNFMINGSIPPGADRKITLNLKNVTVLEATEHLATAVGFSVTARDYAFVFEPK